MSSTAVTERERATMATMREDGAPLAVIAKKIGRSEPTVCIELKSPKTLAILARIRLRNEDKAAQVYAAVLESVARRLADSAKLKPSEAQALEEHAVSLLERGQPTIAELFPQSQAASGPQGQQMTFEEVLVGLRRSISPAPIQAQQQQPAIDVEAE